MLFLKNTASFMAESADDKGGRKMGYLKKNSGFPANYGIVGDATGMKLGNIPLFVGDVVEFMHDGCAERSIVCKDSWGPFLMGFRGLDISGAKLLKYQSGWHVPHCHEVRGVLVFHW